jgi:predicted aspartyl protease
MKRTLLLALLLVPGLALAATAPPSATKILAQTKAATGGDAWNQIHSMRFKATVKTSGLSGNGTILEGLRTGRSVEHFKLGPISGAQGFDGKMGWSKGPGGEVSADNSPEAKKRNLTGAYKTANGWWKPEHWPADIKSLGTRESGDKTYQRVRITPKGGKSFTLWIDPKTHLVARSVAATGMGSVKRTTYFSDYRPVKGVKIPFHQRSSNGKKQYDQIIQIQKVQVNVPVSAEDFAMPGQKINDFSFVGGGDKATIPFKLINNHIFVSAKMDGHPLQFMVDTGAANILLPHAAKRAGIKSEGALEGHGVGKKSVNISLGKVKKLTLGGKITLNNQHFAIMAMPGYNHVEGTEFDGLVGYELFKRFVVRIDYAKHELTFIRPEDFKPANAGTAVPFTSAGGGVPLVKATIDGLSGEFMVDTGSRAALSLLGPFVKKHDLDSRYKTTDVTTLGWGVGGSAKGRATRGGKLTIGKVAVDNPVVELSQAQKGAFAMKHIAGNIGGAILNRFTVTFDYAHERMYLKPNKAHDTPMNFDRSGMWINGSSAGFVVKTVMSGGPAAKAGLKPGDVITAVDGKPAGKIELSDFRAKLRNEAPGTKLKLSLGQDKQAHTVTLKLKRLIPKKGGLKKTD